MDIALVGPGSVAELHARALAEIRRDDASAPVALRAVVGADQRQTEAFARRHGAGTATTELDEVLADARVAAVVICSPSALHAEHAERCLRAGKHVLCEIPLAMSLADTDHLVALAESVDRRLMVCHTQRYWPSSKEARRRIADGEVDPTAVVGRFMFHRHSNVNWLGHRRDWTDDLLWHHACHTVDLALWLLDAEPAAVTAHVALPRGPLHIPMDLTISVRTSADQLVTSVLSYNCHQQLHDHVVVGTQDTLIITEDGLRGRHGGLSLRDADPVREQDAEFLAAVREQRDPAASARSVRPAMSVLQSAQDDAAAHRQARPERR